MYSHGAGTNSLVVESGVPRANYKDKYKGKRDD
jgi:hypothetical protein